MKKLIPILILTLALTSILTGCSSEQLPEEDKEYDMKVLFVGNSYTSLNDLPAMFQELAESGGKSVYQSSSTQDSSTLDDHSSDSSSLGEETLAKINNESIKWDYVVIQEQSVMPIAGHEMFVSGAEDISIAIDEAGAKPVFYMTWGRKDGLAGMGFEEMNAELETAYENEAEYNHGLLAPVGSVWGKLKEEDEDLWEKLWYDDGSHPSYFGSYVNACVFYAVLFEESPVGLWYDSREIEKEDAKAAQEFVESYFEL